VSLALCHADEAAGSIANLALYRSGEADPPRTSSLGGSGEDGAQVISACLAHPTPTPERSVLCRTCDIQPNVPDPVEPRPMMNLSLCHRTKREAYSEPVTLSWNASV
jgi:hypothetical protein